MEPATHAVVIGLRHYPRLPGGSAKKHFASTIGMGQLQSPTSFCASTGGLSKSMNARKTSEEVPGKLYISPELCASIYSLDSKSGRSRPAHTALEKRHGYQAIYANRKVMIHL
jgi:hypothetical protein